MQMAIDNLGRLRPAMRALAAALVIAVLVFSSVADAATCGGEIEDSSSVVALENGDRLPDREAPADDHQRTCPHGHCHHGNQPLGADNRNSGLDHDSDASLFSLVNGAGPEAIPELLIPPPRA